MAGGAAVLQFSQESMRKLLPSPVEETMLAVPEKE
jgi:hypothetical protein